MKPASAHRTHNVAAIAMTCTAILLGGCFDPNGFGRGSCVGTYCYPELADAGTKAGDLAEFLAVQRADELASGNAIVGDANPTGGKGRVSLALLATRIATVEPGIEGVTASTNGSVATDFPTSSGSSTALTANVAVALWRGVAAGATHIGGIGLTAGLTYLQGLPDNSLHPSSNDQLGTDRGYRIGLIEETRTLPGIVYARSQRSVPQFSFHADPMPALGGGTMTIAAEDIDVQVASWRLAAAKRFGRIGLMAGVGGEAYEGSSRPIASLAAPNLPTKTASQVEAFSTHRRSYSVGGSYQAGKVTLVGEFGHLSLAGAYPVHASNTYGGKAADMSRNYLSLGVRMGGLR